MQRRTFPVGSKYFGRSQDPFASRISPVSPGKNSSPSKACSSCSTIRWSVSSPRVNCEVIGAPVAAIPRKLQNYLPTIDGVPRQQVPGPLSPGFRASPTRGPRNTGLRAPPVVERRLCHDPLPWHLPSDCSGCQDLKGQWNGDECNDNSGHLVLHDDQRESG